ncbi:major facilitator superfamily transporter [Colletotrichum orchidophilum]|uniref:Major facilitator superfamily transporter n=1 Tax=Colletotrichum orchidophilum TaxID=1209926 RepID=A0A1G4BK92_9PEZI|nr:major facilitator superfamily transporter [Colletotrichum orchidophilum]OHF01733.1 major facilitator superfamily transporter [Colletotrichum orchidophilum]
MPRLSDEVDEEHLLGAEYAHHEGVLPMDPSEPGPRAGFQAFQRPPPSKWRRPSPGGGSGLGGLGGVIWQAGSRLDAALAPFRARSPRTIIILLALLKFAITIQAMLLMLPMMRLVEDGICHKHFKLGPAETIPEMKCKVDEVQKRLAWLGGWQSLIGAVVNFLVAFPYGVLSDGIGRKAGLVFAYIGTVTAFSWAPFLLAHFPDISIYYLFFGSCFFLFGGGIVVVFNNVYAMAADISTEKDRASNFVLLSVGAVVGGLSGHVCAGFLMEKFGPWLPIRLVFVLAPFIFLIIALLPETLRVKLNPEETPKPQLPLGDAIREGFLSGLVQLKDSLAMLNSRNILLCLVPSLVGNHLMTAHSSTLPQYVSKNFGWTLAQTSFLLSPLGFLHIGTLVLLPWVSKIVVDPRGRFRRTGFGKDALLAKASYIMIAAGALLEAFSREIVVFLLGLVFQTFGSAHHPLVRAMITEFVDPEHTSRLYALTSMVDTLGSPLGGPVLAWAFSLGLEKKGLWKGLPWFYVAVLASLTWAALMLVEEPRKKGPIHLESESSMEGLDYESGAED